MTETGRKITLEEFLALPDDGVERWVKHGILYESKSGENVSQRNEYHCYCSTRMARFLDEWNDTQPVPRGRVYTGDVGVVLSNGDLITYGLDLAYFDAERRALQTGKKTTMLVGAPNIAIEILSPSNSMDVWREKFQTLFDYGAQEVWVLDPYWKIVDIYRPGSVKIAVHNDSPLTSPVLPGFSIPVNLLFD